MTKKNICIIACIIIAVSAFLPYLSASFLGASLSKSLIDGGDGIFVIIIAAIALLCTFKEKYVPVIVCGAASLALFFLENTNIENNMRGANDFARAMLQKGTGYYLLLGGSIALIVFAFMARSEKAQQNGTQTDSTIMKDEKNP